jgi:uncharacterized protein HemX
MNGNSIIAMILLIVVGLIIGTSNGDFLKNNAEAKRMDMETTMLVDQYELARPFQEQQFAAETAVIIAEKEKELERLEALHQAEMNRIARESQHHAANLAIEQERSIHRNNIWLETERNLLFAGTVLLSVTGLCLIIILSLVGYKTLDYHIQRRMSLQSGDNITRQITLEPLILRPKAAGSPSRRSYQPRSNGTRPPYISQDRGIVGD